MRIGKVAGTLVATAKDPQIVGNTIRLVEVIDYKGNNNGEFEVAADTVGAKKGDWVLLVKSSSARMTKLTEDKPIDDAIVAIIDVIEVDGRVVYKSPDIINSKGAKNW